VQAKQSNFDGDCLHIRADELEPGA